MPKNQKRNIILYTRIMKGGCLMAKKEKIQLQLSDRTYVCPVCGHVMDRDEQAAKNIDEEGIRIYRQLQNLLFT